MAEKNKKLRKKNKMKKQIALALVAAVVVVGGVAALSAFEAHVINVTATIENALDVSPDPLLFGTVFPNERVVEDLTVALSGSFQDQERLDDVEYIIRQKAKPYEEEDHDYCQSELERLQDCVFNSMDLGMSLEDAIESCAPDYDTDSCYRPLCPFLSKEEDFAPDNDQGVSAPHGVPGPDALGLLTMAGGDFEDIWGIDLEVPCFIGNCSQGETGYLPADWESEEFGCDLWVEVTGFSEPPRPE